MYYVYMHTTPDGKVYVGETKSPIRRWANGDGYIDNPAFYKAIQLFGWNNIKHEIIAQYNTQVEAKVCEAIIIHHLNSEDSEIGYNQTNISASVMEAFVKRTQVDGVDFEKADPAKNILEESGLPISACEKMIDQWIFNQKSREIAKARMLDGVQYPELSKQFNLSIRQLKHIVSECSKILIEHI